MRDPKKVWDLRSVYELFGLSPNQPIPPDMADVRDYAGVRVRLLRTDAAERKKPAVLRCRFCGIRLRHAGTETAGAYAHVHGKKASRFRGPVTPEEARRADREHEAEPRALTRGAGRGSPRIVVDCGCGKTVAFGRMVQHAARCDWARMTGPVPMENPTPRADFPLPVVDVEEWDDGIVVEWVDVPFPVERKPLSYSDDRREKDERVPLMDIIATQRRVTRAGVEKWLTRPHDKVRVLKTRDGRYYIADGHHRAVAAYLRGDRDVSAEVYRVRENPEKRARPPKARREAPHRRRNPAPDWEVAKRIVEASARAAYVDAFHTRMQDLGLPLGEPLGEKDRPTSAEARAWAVDLWEKIIDKNPLSARMSFHEAVEEVWGEVAERERQGGHDFAFRIGDELDVQAHKSEPGRGLSYPKFRAKMLDAGRTGGWDVYDVEDAKTGKQRSVYGFSLSTSDEAPDVFDDEKLQDEFGYYIAMQAMGSGASWMDDHADHELEVPKLDAGFDPWGIVPEADLLARPRADLPERTGVTSDMLVGVIAQQDEDFGAGDIGEDGSTAQHAYQFVEAENEWEHERGNEQDMSHVVPVMEALSNLVTHLNYAAAYEDEGLERAFSVAHVLYDGRQQLRRRHYLAVHFETYTYSDYPEAEQHETGFYEGVDVEPDDVDEVDGVTAVDKVVKHIQEQGSVEPSNSSFHPETWYTQVDGASNFMTNESTRYSFHLYSFTEAEEREVFARLTGKKR